MPSPRVLAVDIGTGTQDILLFEAGTVIENAVQLVMPSPTALLAERVKRATADRADLVLTGVTMGGGPAQKPKARGQAPEPEGKPRSQ